MEYNEMKEIAKANNIKFVGVKKDILFKNLESAGLLKTKKQEKPKTESTPKFDYSSLPAGLIDHGKKGVTNAQMIPAIKNAIAENNISGLKILKLNFPIVYESTIKYLKKDEKAKLATMAI